MNFQILRIAYKVKLNNLKAKRYKLLILMLVSALTIRGDLKLALFELTRREH